MVEIVTQWPGHAAEEVERLITVPMESEMNGLPGLNVVRSISLYGLSDVRLTFEDGTDNYFARQQVFERMPDVGVPDGVTPVVSPLFSPSGLVYRYVLQSPDRSAMELKMLRTGCCRRRIGPCPAWPTCRRSAARRCSTRSARSDEARRRRPVGRRRSPRRWRRTTATPAAASTPKAASSTTCAASDACRTPRTSATSSSRSRTARRFW